MFIHEPLAIPFPVENDATSWEKKKVDFSNHCFGRSGQSQVKCSAKMGRVMLLSLTRVSRASLQKWTIKNN
jgi:hypothetical protein